MNNTKQSRSNTTKNHQSNTNKVIGKTFYTRCPNNMSKYRTIEIQLKPFVNAITPVLSSSVYDYPPEGIEEINSLLLTRVMRMPLKIKNQ